MPEQTAHRVASTWDNPAGVDGFEFVEFAAPQPAPMHQLFQRLGFVAVARHRRLPVTLYRQGEINFLLNESAHGHAAEFARRHGPSACGFALRVGDAGQAQAYALARGASELAVPRQQLPLDAPALEGIGASTLYLVQRDAGQWGPYAREFEPLPGAPARPQGLGLLSLDHLTHNVFMGNMDRWADFYQRLFNFREIRYFDIRGQRTGLVSRAMTSPCGKVRIPINEATDERSQIQEFLQQYNGEGIQHIALLTEDIHATVEALRANGMVFLDVPDSYYEMIDERVPGHREDLERMRRNRILIDCDPDDSRRLLLQIFTRTCIGPIFFEIIQRKGNQGFGEGNFRALFESIEREQMRRGVI